MMRRTVTFCLTLCLLAALLLPVSAASAPFQDLNRIENRSQAALLVDLGLISGYADGAFHPEGSITRAETAKLLALLCEASPTAAGSVFSDLEDCWAAGYINYCAARGILSGSGGRFRPQDFVTGRELAKMLLVVLGEDPAPFTGAGWESAVDAAASEKGVYTGFERDPALTVTRDDACLLIYNAMQCLALDGRDSTGAAVYAVDDLLNPITYLEKRFGVVRYTSILTGNEYGNLTGSSPLAKGLSKLAGHKEFAVTTAPGLLGRCVDIYVRDGQVLGAPCQSPSATSYTFTSLQELEQLCGLTDFAVAEDAAVYCNFAPGSYETLSHLTGPLEITAVDQDGDRLFEHLSAVRFTTGLVAEAEPLTVQTGGATVHAQAYETGGSFEAGEAVLCVQLGGTWFVK